MSLLSFQCVHCPYCGEPQDIAVDTSAGDQHYVEDCQVCCRPMQVQLDVDDDGTAQVHVSGENEA